MAYEVTVTRLTVWLEDGGDQTFEASSFILADNGDLDLATTEGAVKFEDTSWAGVTITRNLEH